jgi:hypothetical protein
MDGWLFKSMAQAKVSLQLRRKKKSHINIATTMM